MAEYTHHDLTYHIRAAKKEGAADMRERAAKLCDKFDAPVSDSEFVNAQAIAAQQIRAMIRALDIEKAAPAGEG